VATVGKGMHARKDGRAGRWGVLRGRAPGSHWRRRQLRLGRALRVVGTGVGAIGLAVALLGQSGVVSAPATQLAAKSTSTGPLLVVANQSSARHVNSGNGDVVTYPTTLSEGTSAVGTFDGDGVDGPTDVAVDPQTGDVWVVNAMNDELQVFSPSAIHATGTLSPSETFTYATSGYPEAITFDSSGDLYIANSTGTFDEYTASELANARNGSELSDPALHFGSNSLQPVTGIAANGSDIWIVTQGGTSSAGLSEYSGGTLQWSVTIVSNIGQTFFGYGLALDSRGDLWVSGTDAGYPGAIVELSQSALDGLTSKSTTITPSFSINGSFTSLNFPRGITFDSSGNLWVANYAGQDLLEFSESDLGGGQDSGYFGKPTQSFVEPDGEQPSGLAVLPENKKQMVEIENRI